MTVSQARPTGVLNRARQLGPQVRNVVRGRANVPRYFERYQMAPSENQEQQQAHLKKQEQTRNNIQRKVVPQLYEDHREPRQAPESPPTPPPHQYLPRRDISPADRSNDGRRQAQKRPPGAPDDYYRPDYPAASPPDPRNDRRNPPRRTNQRV